MSTLHLTRGLPASGKTTWAKEWAAQPFRARVKEIAAMYGVHKRHAGEVINGKAWRHVL